MDAHKLRGQKFRGCGIAPVNHFAVYSTTSYIASFGDILFRA